MFYINIWLLKGASKKKCTHCGNDVGKMRVDLWSGKMFTYCSVECMREEMEKEIEFAIEKFNKKLPVKRYDWS